MGPGRLETLPENRGKLRNPASANRFLSIIDIDFQTFTTSEWFKTAIDIKSRHVIPPGTVESVPVVPVPLFAKNDGTYPQR